MNKKALEEYARQAADFSTNYKLPQLEFAVNHYGQPDVAMFDFTSMYAAENASRVVEKRGHRLLMTLVGDSLLEVPTSDELKSSRTNLQSDNNKTICNTVTSP